MVGLDQRSNAEHIQRRCFDLLVWTLQHFTSKLQHFFLTHQRSFNPFRDQTQFWDTGYRADAITREYVEKIKAHLYPYWQNRYATAGNHHHAFTELATEILDPTSPLCQALEIGGNEGDEEKFGFHLELIGGAVGQIISTEALAATAQDRVNRFNLPDLLTIAATNQNPNPKQYKQIKESNLIAVLNYSAQNREITANNIHIYLAEYIYARLSSFKKRLPIGFVPILMPLRGLGQWRAMAGWLCPNNKQLKEHLRTVRRTQPESLLLAIEEIYSVNLIEVFIFLLEEALLKLTDATERINQAAAIFSQLWIAGEIRFYRDNALVLTLSADQPSTAGNVNQTINSESLSERAKLLVIEEDSDQHATVVINLNKHQDLYLLRRALGFDLIVYRDCPHIRLNLPGQEEYWERQIQERLAHTAAVIIKEQYLLTQGLTHEIMNTLSRRSRYRVLFAKALNNQPIDNAELLYTCSILQQLYYLTDTIRTVTKFDDPRSYLIKFVTKQSGFELADFAPQWRQATRAVIEQLLLGINNLGAIPVIFHQPDCQHQGDCSCPRLTASGSSAQIPTFVPFGVEVTSLFLVGIHESLGNAAQYLIKQQEINHSLSGFISNPLDCRIEIDFQLIELLELEDQYYQLRIGNPVQPDEKPRELSDGLKRTESLLSCFVFRNHQGREKRLVEFALLDQSKPDYHSLAIRFRPQLVIG